jgi:hypothetical protein
MICKSTVLAVILFFGVLSVAEAQLKGEEAVNGGELRADQPPTAQAVAGVWNFFHVTNCYTDGGALYVFPAESAVVNVLFTTNPIFAATIAPACQTGNWMAVFVTSVSGLNFTWNQLTTFSFK